MRSKEVEKGIETLRQYTLVGSEVTQLEACECIDIVLNYISDLEEKSKKCEYYEEVADELYKNSISKDKISEIIEKERCKTIDGYNDWKYDEDVYEAERNMINIIEKAILEGE